MKTGNPALKEGVFTSYHTSEKSMTVDGAINKSFILLLLVMATAFWSWSFTMPAILKNPNVFSPLLLFGAIGGFVVALVTIFKKEWSPITAPIYAALEGIFLGGISATFELKFPGIVLQAMTATFGTFAALLFIYKSGLVKVTDGFRTGLFAATGGIFAMYLIVFILGFFGVNMPYLHDSSPLSIGISIFVIIVAALNLILDFDAIEQGAKAKAPEFMEWYCSFSLLVTIVWLYIEFLKLIAKIRSQD